MADQVNDKNMVYVREVYLQIILRIYVDKKQFCSGIYFLENFLIMQLILAIYRCILVSNKLSEILILYSSSVS